MKWIAIFLLVANVTYLGWQMNRRIDQVVPTTAIEEESSSGQDRSLTLLSELDEPPPLRNEEVVISEEPIDPQANDRTGIDAQSFPGGDKCISIGPFSDETRFRETETWFITHDIPVHKRAEEVRTQERYWVYLEPRNEKEAKKKLEELKRKGLKDYYLVSKGDMKNAISLGLFSSQDAVNRRLVELEREGYHPVVVPQHKITQVYWLDIQAVDRQTLPDLPEEIKVIDKDCQEIALLGAPQ